ncbi:hypothetical protein EV426DRAFT_577405 [Tirmania nivea]|nr:hypothetical protein EV426DRAFT_577405 [Tirmania nivea]
MAGVLIDKNHQAGKAVEKNPTVEYFHIPCNLTIYPNTKFIQIAMSVPAQRQAWSESERQAIRDYATAHPGSSWRTIKRWFEGIDPTKVLTQSQISRTLNPKRAVPPMQHVQKLLPTAKRMRRGKFPRAQKWSFAAREGFAILE